MNRKSIAVILGLLLSVSLICLSACGNAKSETSDNTASAETADLNITGSGTDEDPWLIGADSREDITVTVNDGSLWVSGTGRMLDFESAEQRPWNDIAADLTDVSISDSVENVGALAFMGAGRNSDNFDVGFYCDLISIGDRAFEGANFSDSSILTIPESAVTVGSRAFADSSLNEMYIDGTPEIADDAFEGVTSRVCVRSNGTWNKDNMLPYGGELNYVYTYAVKYTEDYGVEDINGEGVMYSAEDMLFEYDADAYAADENYHFVRYEVLSGSLELADPANPLISAQLSDNVELKIIYEHN